MRLTLGIVLAAGFFAVSCRTVPTAAAVAGIDPSKLIDLTYTFDEKTVYWPNAQGFRHRKDMWAVSPNGYWYAAGGYAGDEHGGTHVDSPVHFSQGKRTLDQIPVSDLVAPSVVIDISAQSARDRDYRASPEDVLAWEKEYGSIPPRSIVVFRTGWGRFWPDRKQYLGSDAPGDITHLHFPGLTRQTAELLVKRRPLGVGIDTASIDYGPSADFIVHQVLNGAGIFGIENIANADRLPSTGATMIALPMKIGEGSGGPARVVALLP
jgi:kynurenine formamidase